MLGRDGNPWLDVDGNQQPIHISTQDWRYYAKPRYVDDATIVQMGTTGQVQFAMPLGAPTLVQLIRNGWEPLISFQMMHEHDPSSSQTAVANRDVGGTGLLANREWVQQNRDTVYRLLSVAFRTVAYLEHPDTQADGRGIIADYVNTHRQTSFDAVDMGIILETIDPLFTWEDQRALWDTNLPSYHPETVFAQSIEDLKRRGVLSADFDTEAELAKFLLAQDLYYQMKGMQIRSGQLLAKAAGMALTNEQTALLQQARTFYQRYNFLDALRTLEEALSTTPTNP